MMKRNQLTTTKSAAMVLGRSKSLMNITKKILSGSNKDLVKANPTHKDITLIGELMWEKETRDMSWYEAMEYAENLRLGGYDDWRLPTIEELAEVVELCGGTLTSVEDDDWKSIWDENEDNETYQSNYEARGFASNDYWSSTTVAGFSSYAWNVYFYDGSQYGNYKSDSYYVRCVRAGQ